MSSLGTNTNFFTKKNVSSNSLCCTRRRRPTDPLQTLTIDRDLRQKIKTAEKAIGTYYNEINRGHNEFTFHVQTTNLQTSFLSIIFAPFFSILRKRIPDCTLQPTGEEELKRDKIQALYSAYLSVKEIAKNIDSEKKNNIDIDTLSQNIQKAIDAFTKLEETIKSHKDKTEPLITSIILQPALKGLTLLNQMISDSIARRPNDDTNRSFSLIKQTIEKEIEKIEKFLMPENNDSSFSKEIIKKITPPLKKINEKLNELTRSINSIIKNKEYELSPLIVMINACKTTCDVKTVSNDLNVVLDRVNLSSARLQRASKAFNVLFNDLDDFIDRETNKEVETLHQMDIVSDGCEEISAIQEQVKPSPSTSSGVDFTRIVPTGVPLSYSCTYVPDQPNRQAPFKKQKKISREPSRAKILKLLEIRAELKMAVMAHSHKKNEEWYEKHREIETRGRANGIYWLNVEAAHFEKLNIPDDYNKTMMDSLHMAVEDQKGFAFVGAKINKNGKKEYLYKYRFPGCDGRIYFTAKQHDSGEFELIPYKYADKHNEYPSTIREWKKKTSSIF